ncbi:MAG TPA: hypothetical protein QF753_16585 [Victivallales bacterium]|nr:hypothetical protein [Victivallales bacterium]
MNKEPNIHLDRHKDRRKFTASTFDKMSQIIFCIIALICIFIFVIEPLFLDMQNNEVNASITSNNSFISIVRITFAISLIILFAVCVKILYYKIKRSTGGKIYTLACLLIIVLLMFIGDPFNFYKPNIAIWFIIDFFIALFLLILLLKQFER